MTRVLVVDDEKSIRFTLGEFLRRADYEAEVAPDAATALQLLRDGEFDVVLTDIIMPRMSGIELLHEIRKTDVATQVIVVTGEPSLDTAVEAVRAGAHDYLAKPVRRDALLKTVGQAARVKHLIDEKRRLEEANRRYREDLESMVHSRTEALQETMGDIISLISSIVEIRDIYTAGHQRRVGNLAADLARELKMNDDTVESIRTAGYIHDIGKIRIPAEILAKPGRLDEEEMALIRIHPATGFELLERVHLPVRIPEMVYQHHERSDGSGYPRGLTDEEMLPESQVLIVADVVEAMISHRPYRPALGIDVALEEIGRHSGILYSARVAKACEALFSRENYRISDSEMLVRFPLEF